MAKKIVNVEDSFVAEMGSYLIHGYVLFAQFSDDESLFTVVLGQHTDGRAVVFYDVSKCPKASSFEQLFFKDTKTLTQVLYSFVGIVSDISIRGILEGMCVTLGVASVNPQMFPINEVEIQLGLDAGSLKILC